MRSFRCLLIFASLLFGHSAGAQTAAKGDIVAGKVVDARTGQPLPHALVTLQNLRSNRDAGGVYTGDDGSYSFGEPVPAGKYRLTARASGHIAGAYLEHGQLSTAIVTGAGLSTGNLVLSLLPAATLSGRVVDENGEPVPHATVSLFRQSTDFGTLRTRMAGSRPVSDDGTYDFGPLTPGRYFLVARGVPWYAVHPPQDQEGSRQLYRVAVDPSLDVAYPTVYYPEARSADGASPLDLAGGEEITANLRLEAEHAVTLSIRRLPDTPNGIPPQLTEMIFGTEQPVQTQTNVNEALTTITGLAPGRYNMREYAGNGNRLPTDAGMVDLTGGSLTRSAVPPSQRASLTVTLRATGADSLPKEAMVTLDAGAPGTGFGPRVSSPVNDKGEAEFQDVPPGEYRLRIGGNRRLNLPTGSVTLNGRPASAAHLTLSGGGHFAATAILTGLPVTVEGFARRGDKPAAACMIVLVPAGATTDPELFRRDQSDLDGSFSLPGVAPGKYLLIALENAWSLPWTDVHALEPYLLQAQPVEVPPGSSSTVKLPTPVVPQRLR